MPRHTHAAACCTLLLPRNKQVLARFAARPPVAVRLDAGGGRGKGLFATRAIAEGELIFEERALAGVQHPESKVDVPACPQCFRPIGESGQGGQATGKAARAVFLHECVRAASPPLHQPPCLTPSPRFRPPLQKPTLQQSQTATPEHVVGRMLCTAIGELSGDLHANHKGRGGRGGNGDGSDDEAAAAVAAEAAERLALISEAVDARTLEGLMEGGHRLPRSDLVETPEPAPCPGGCGERYCGAACAQAAWAAHHCLLCPVGDVGGGGSGSGAAAGGSSKGKGKARAPAPRLGCGAARAKLGGKAGGSGSGSRADETVNVAGVRLARARLAAFFEFADETNDQFRLAAQVLAMVLVRADAELTRLTAHEQQQEQQQEEQEESSSGGGGGEPSPDALREALRRAWLPVAVAQKAPYWEVAAWAPPGSDDADSDEDEEEDEPAFRARVKEATADALRLLRAAWRGVRWPELLSLEAFGSVVGMFEQNNLALNVPSPADVYFAALQDPERVPDADERAALEAAAAPLRAALGGDAGLEAAAVQGTAFYALQSCCNHSCDPAAEAEGDPAGAARIVAKRGIAEGEEVTLSYVDEAAPLEARRRALAEYGFACGCARCAAEEGAAAAGGGG